MQLTNVHQQTTQEVFPPQIVHIQIQIQYIGMLTALGIEKDTTFRLQNRV